MKRAGEDVASDEVRDYLYSIDTYEKVVAFYKKYYHLYSEAHDTYGDDYHAYAESRFNEMREIDESIRESIDENLYEALWELFIQSGAPKVDWVDNAKERSKRKFNEYAGSNYFLYKDSNGEPIIKIDKAYKSDKALAVLIDEMAHSLSFHKNPERFFEGRQALIDFKKDKDLTDLEVKKEIISFYLEPGNEEYLAHQVIFPRLIKFIGQYHPTMNKYLQAHQENYKRLRELQNE